MNDKKLPLHLKSEAQGFSFEGIAIPNHVLVPMGSMSVIPIEVPTYDLPGYVRRQALESENSIVSHSRPAGANAFEITSFEYRTQKMLRFGDEEKNYAFYAIRWYRLDLFCFVEFLVHLARQARSHEQYEHIVKTYRYIHDLV